jgi:phospholipid/cholesterol/gamma-HCH transport system substrate-binding protein
LPCMGHPGKRAPTVQICDSDQQFQPLALREHVLGPGPLDPNLISQGIPPDNRVAGQDQLYGPVEGTPPPSGIPPPPSEVPPPTADPSAEVPPPPSADGGPGPVVAPSSFHQGAAGAPSVAVATYDPRTGRYLGPDGRAYTQTDLVPASIPETWKDLILKVDS